MTAVAAHRTVSSALRACKFYNDGKRYRMAKSHLSRIQDIFSVLHEEPPGPFLSLMVDKDEVSIMLENDVYESWQQLHPGTELEAVKHAYKLITFDVVLDPELVGFMAAVSKVLADQGVSILAFAAYSRDHVFVHEKDYARAISSLEDFSKSNNEQ